MTINELGLLYFYSLPFAAVVLSLIALWASDWKSDELDWFKVCVIICTYPVSVPALACMIAIVYLTEKGKL